MWNMVNLKHLWRIQVVGKTISTWVYETRGWKKGLSWTFKWNLQLKRRNPSEYNFLQCRDFCLCYMYLRASLVAQPIKNRPAMQETWVLSLSWEDPLEKGKATHSSILALRIPWTVQSMRSQRVRHEWATFTFTSLSYAPKITSAYRGIWSINI